VIICNARDKFLLAKSTKKVLRRVNFTNLKTPDGYIAKSKPQGVCLQLSQTPGGDYVIWPLFFFKLKIKFYHSKEHSRNLQKDLTIHNRLTVDNLIVIHKNILGMDY
jgi:hypothetical protein